MIHSIIYSTIGAVISAAIGAVLSALKPKEKDHVTLKALMILCVALCLVCLDGLYTDDPVTAFPDVLIEIIFLVTVNFFVWLIHRSVGEKTDADTARSTGTVLLAGAVVFGMITLIVAVGTCMEMQSSAALTAIVNELGCIDVPKFTVLACRAAGCLILAEETAAATSFLAELISARQKPKDPVLLNGYPSIF